MKRTPKDIEQKIIEAYIAGDSMAVVAEKLSVTTFVVFRVLKSYNIPARKHQKLTNSEKQGIKKEYLKGISTHKLADKYNVSVKTVCDVLKTFNISRNNRYSNLSLDVNYWQTIDSKDKAYFLGLMITDGCVWGNRNVDIMLTESDRHILETFRKYTGNEVKITTRNRSIEGKKNECKFTVSCSKWVKDLSKYGVVPRKTSSVYLPDLHEDMMSHLIRGMFDGDGWITGLNTIGFCGNERCVTELRDYLVKNLNVLHVKVSKTGTQLWQCVWCSKKDFKTICEYIYKDKDDLYLIRKFNKFDHVNTVVSGNLTTPTTVTRRD